MTQVCFLPKYVEVAPNFLHALPALIKARLGVEKIAKTKEKQSMALVYRNICKE
jgi:hypothetical protein